MDLYKDTNQHIFADQTTQDKPSSHRFQKLSDKEVQEIFDLDIQSKATKQNTRWGVKILQGVYDCFRYLPLHPQNFYNR